MKKMEFLSDEFEIRYPEYTNKGKRKFLQVESANKNIHRN